MSTLVLGPGDTQMACQTNDYYTLDRIPVAVAMFADVINDWTKAAG